MGRFKDENKPVFVSPYSIMVHNKNMLYVLLCPFTARCIKSVGLIEKGQVVNVDMVKTQKSGMLAYIIEGQAYHYSYFHVVDVGG